jgi:hypothetical protein
MMKRSLGQTLRGTFVENVKIGKKKLTHPTVQGIFEITNIFPVLTVAKEFHRFL